MSDDEEWFDEIVLSKTVIGNDASKLTFSDFCQRAELDAVEYKVDKWTVNYQTNTTTFNLSEIKY